MVLFLSLFTMNTRTKDAGKEPEETAAPEAAETVREDPDEVSAKKPDNGPLWSDESESRRVRATIWSHSQKGGRRRFTVGICRSYFSEREGHWVNSFYYDERDLDDVIAFAQEAKKKLARMNGESA
jgi:hypothetical protein